ncbi:hypothetical protein [Bradyrhizobium sp. BR 1433]|uniref:hypothetical protein n=1 Tax=Bradyrhizobium sp. BR 1433 TaxID=3447967 RepID=UPI003EE6D358
MGSDAPLSGNRFNLYRIVNNNPVFVCAAVNLGLTETKQFDDATMPDCDNPTAIPTRKSVVKSKEWSLNFGGKAVMKHYTDLKTDKDSEAPVPYRIVANPIDNQGGGRWDGLLHFESLELTKNDNGIVTFTCQCRGDGDLTFLAA